MNRILKIFLLILLLMLSACSTETTVHPTEQPTITVELAEHEASTVNDKPDTADIPKEIKEILLGKSEFFETGIMEAIKISELGKAVSTDTSLSVKITEYAAADLNNDGTNEIILRISVNENDYYGNEVLHFNNGKVYGYLLSYRAFNNIKCDGSFSFSGGAADSGYGFLNFDGPNYFIEKAAYSESGFDSAGNLIIRYFIEEHEVKQAEFDSAIIVQDKKEKIIWLSFDEAAINK